MIQSNVYHKAFNFPVGEMQVSVPSHAISGRNILDAEFQFTKNEDIIELLLLVDAAKRQGHRLGRLTMPYVPFSRQDRCNAPGEAFSLKVFCDLINSMGWESVGITDPHSDVTPALLNNCVVRPQWDVIARLINNHMRCPFYLVSPDAGALKKIYKLAENLNHDTTPGYRGVIEASKSRNVKTGAITGSVVHATSLPSNVTYAIVDDICDGGRTFIELAKVMREMGAETIHLYVTHGFFTKGKGVFKDIIDEVYEVYDYSQKGTV